MLVSLLIALKVLLVLLVFSALTHAQAQGFKPIFKQDELNEVRSSKGREVSKYMNLSVDPCNDFYEFACGNWAKYHMPLREHEVVTPESELHTKINNDLQALLQEQVTLEDGTIGRKVKEFYKSCISAERNGLAQQAFLSDFIKTNGGFPAVPGTSWSVHHDNYNWQHTVAQLRHRYGMNILIGLEVDVNPLNSNENSVFLTEPSTVIPSELCSAEGTSRVDIRDHKYQLLENEIAKNLEMWLAMKLPDAKEVAAKIVTFEYDLCAGINTTKDEDRSSPLPNYERKTLNVFTHQLNDSIDFNQFATTSLGTPIYRPVFMKAEGYYKQLVKTINDYTKSTIANYIMYRALSILNFPQDDHPSRRPHYCIDVLKRYLPKAVGDMYYRKFASASGKTEVEAMFDRIKESFRKSLGSPWIEESTRRVGEKRLLDIVLFFPKYEKIDLSSLQIDRNDYWRNLAQAMAQVKQQVVNRILATGQIAPKDEVEAYELRLKYRPTQKRIDIGWALLQSALYQPLYPAAMRYAMIGHWLATELASAFDERSWTTDYLGLSNWDRQTSSGYQKRMECFRRQISNYHHNNPDSFKNTTRLRELIATSAGLNVAFNAYLGWLGYLNPNNDFAILSKETLSELNFTNTQLFFIAYAQMRCRGEKITKPATVFGPLQLHTPERYEVNGPLRNFAEFARDFSCTAGAPMNVADKCVIY